MATQTVDFNDIKLILCVQGYHLDYQYVVREIGFWSDGLSGSIPFNVKLNKSQLNAKNLATIEFCQTQFNGIGMKKSFDDALAASDYKPVLRTLFHMVPGKSSSSKYIAILRDEPLDGLLFRSGLNNYVTYLENVNVIKNNNSSIPSNEYFRQYLKKNFDAYQICPLHDRLTINELPLCAKAKAEFLADFCKALAKNQAASHQQQVVSIPENPKTSLQTFLTEFDVSGFV